MIALHPWEVSQQFLPTDGKAGPRINSYSFKRRPLSLLIRNDLPVARP